MLLLVVAVFGAKMAGLGYYQEARKHRDACEKKFLRLFSISKSAWGKCIECVTQVRLVRVLRFHRPGAESSAEKDVESNKPKMKRSLSSGTLTKYLFDHDPNETLKRAGPDTSTHAYSYRMDSDIVMGHSGPLVSFPPNLSSMPAMRPSIQTGPARY